MKFITAAAALAVTVSIFTPLSANAEAVTANANLAEIALKEYRSTKTVEQLHKRMVDEFQYPKDVYAVGALESNQFSFRAGADVACATGVESGKVDVQEGRCNPSDVPAPLSDGVLGAMLFEDIFYGPEIWDGLAVANITPLSDAAATGGVMQGIDDVNQDGLDDDGYVEFTGADNSVACAVLPTEPREAVKVEDKACSELAPRSTEGMTEDGFIARLKADTKELGNLIKQKSLNKGVGVSKLSERAIEKIFTKFNATKDGRYEYGTEWRKDYNGHWQAVLYWDYYAGIAEFKSGRTPGSGFKYILGEI